MFTIAAFPFTSMIVAISEKSYNTKTRMKTAYAASFRHSTTRNGSALTLTLTLRVTDMLARCLKISKPNAYQPGGLYTCRQSCSPPQYA